MAENGVTLSICIPTYNRSEYIIDLIHSVYEMLPLDGAVEVVVCDNCSTDNTWVLLNEISNTYSSLKCYKQKYNVSIDENMIDTISFSSGQYVHPLGDDDLYVENKLEDLLKYLDGANDLIVLNGWHVDGELNVVRQHLSDDVCGKVFTDPRDAIRELWNKMPFGSFVARKSLFNKEIMLNYLGTSHAYTGAVWDVLANKYSDNDAVQVMSICQKIILLRGGDKTWKESAVKIMIYEMPKWIYLLPEFYRVEKNIIMTKYEEIYLGISNLLLYRSSNKLNKESVSSLAAYLRPATKMKLYIISFMPLLIVKKLRRILQLIFSLRVKND